MDPTIKNPLFVFLMTVAAAVFLTYLTRGFAREFGFVAKPKTDRWHKRTTAMLGGAAIYLTTILAYAFLVEKTAESGVIIVGGTLLFFVGLLDDIVNIKPYQKLVGQLAGAALVVGFGMKLPITGNEIVDIWITVFWIIGITNAINLLDNMDGLAAGIASIASFSLLAGLIENGQSQEATFVAALIGALVGFLVFNFNPASIFMGDCGSMFVGFVVSTSVLIGQSGGRSRGILSILAVPVLILFVPIFDTTFVTIIRKMWGRKASQGGRDHTSHRLVALGLSERNAVLMLYVLALTAGILSLVITRLSPTQSIAAIAVFTIALAIIGVFLSKVTVYDQKQEDLAASQNAVFGYLVNISYKRRLFEVFLDAFLITLSSYFSYALLFRRFEETANWDLFVKTLPILIVLKLFAFLAAGVYRGLWRYTSIRDLITFVRAVILGSVLSIVAILLLYRFQNFSRAVFLVDGILLLTAVVGSRLAFRLIRELIPMPHANEGRRVLIYGAGDGGEMVLRELRNNPDWNYQAIGFVDDDPLKRGKFISGLNVFDGNGSLQKLCIDKEIQEILISSKGVSAKRLRELRDECRDAEVLLKRAELRIEPVDFE